MSDAGAPGGAAALLVVGRAAAREGKGGEAETALGAAIGAAREARELGIANDACLALTEVYVSNGQAVRAMALLTDELRHTEEQAHRP
jgi:uncharacterized protein HemY